jgi:hypothetical protein
VPFFDVRSPNFGRFRLVLPNRNPSLTMNTACHHCPPAELLAYSAIDASYDPFRAR